MGRGDRLRREDGNVTVGRDAQGIVNRDADKTFGSKDELVAAYKGALADLDQHFSTRPGAGAEARRADFDLTKLYADKGRTLVPDEGFEGLVDELLTAKQGLSGLGIDEGDYRSDMDKDGLSARAELIAGSSDFAIDTDLDGLTDMQEVGAGLDAGAPRTEAGIESDGWGINGLVWYPYFDDKPVLAFSKYDQVFGADTSTEFEPFFEAYAAGSQGNKGTWIPNTGVGRPGYVRESDFARTSGVNPVDEPLIPSNAVRLMRRSGAPQDAKFALRGPDGTPVDVQDGDTLRPTFESGGKLQLAEARSIDGEAAYFKPGTQEQVSSSVAYRAVSAEGTIRGADAKPESRGELLGLRSNLKFDFLDKQNRTVDYNPEYGDKIATSFKDGDNWIALVAEKGDDGAVTGYEKLTLDSEGQNVTARESLTTDAGKALIDDNESHVPRARQQRVAPRRRRGAELLRRLLVGQVPQHRQDRPVQPQAARKACRSRARPRRRRRAGGSLRVGRRRADSQALARR
jgi:hypothetical protein